MHVYMLTFFYKREQYHCILTPTKKIANQDDFLYCVLLGIVKQGLSSMEVLEEKKCTMEALGKLLCSVAYVFSAVKLYYLNSV